MQSRVHALVWAQERRLQCEAIHKLEFSPHHDARCRLSTLLHGEGAVLEPERVDVLAEEPATKV